MTRDDAPSPTECIARLAAQLSAEPRLKAELQRARRQFFGHDGPADDVAEHRFAEWFVLEHESDVLGAVPATIEPYARLAEPLTGSMAGLFLVLSTDGAVTARDVQDESVVELADSPGLQVGDLLVGRLYPAPGERWQPSAATPALRPGTELAAAFARDLGRLGLDRRLQQIELEHLLLQKYDGERTFAAGDESDVAVPGPPPAPPVPLERLEAHLEQLLQAAGDRHSATTISQQLAVAPRPGSLIGPLLDQLAFDTDVDLDRARQLMLEIWNAHHAGEAAAAAPSSGPPGETLGERLVRTLDQGLGEHRDVEELFGELERIAGIAGDDDDDDDDAGDPRRTAIVDELAGGGDDVGDLGPLVTEFQWETGAEQTGDSALSLWVGLQQNAPVPNTDFESIGTPDLMRLFLHVYLRSAPARRVAAVRAAFDELARFFEWAAETQEVDRRESLQACRGPLLDQLDRLQRASLLLGDEREPAAAPRLLQVEDLGGDGFGARDPDGDGYWFACGPDAVAALRVGDLVLGGFAAPERGDRATERRLCGLVVVLPMDARSLID